MHIDRPALLRALRMRQFHTMFQPIHSLTSGQVVGVEALTRFVGAASPDRWFESAHAHGLGVDLELAAAGQALASASALAEPSVLWVNLSPAVLVTPVTRELLAGGHPRLGVQLTGPVSAAELVPVLRACADLHHRGVLVSVDAQLAHQVSITSFPATAPDRVRSGIELTPELASRAGRRAARQLVTLAHQLGSTLVAEGVETPQQLLAWNRLGATEAQGFLLGAPGPLTLAVRALPIGTTNDLPSPFAVAASA